LVLIDSVKVLRSARHETGHFGETLLPARLVVSTEKDSFVLQ